MKIKKSFVAFGICIALAGTFCASMLPWRYSRRAEALVLVKDPANIAEAIKMVNHTLNILTAEQERIALQLLQMKKLDQGTLNLLWQSLKTDKEFAEKLAKGEAGKWGNVLYKVDGMLSGSKSIPTTWSEGLGEVTDILDGQMKQGGCFGTGNKGLVVLNQIFKDTATVAQAGQVSDVELMKMAYEAYEKGQQAEGQLQATQAGNAIGVATTAALLNGNRALGYFASSYAAQQQHEIAKEAANIRATKELCDYNERCADLMHNYDWNH